MARNARREARAAGVAYLKEKLDWEDLQAIEDRADLWSQRLREARDRDERLSGEVPRPGGAQA
ncbi:MAG: hypothetical protein ACTIL2_10165 [Corynebacterium sp.]|uniref:hypothetical protein n=1 Tax=Corynebacterium sp. TaxID=1720 RepID=UPI003F986A3C